LQTDRTFVQYSAVKPVSATIKATSTAKHIN